jgi:hypothetical protein
VPQLRFREKDIWPIAARYEYQDHTLTSLKSSIQQRGYLLKDELREIARWKAPRSAGHVEKNAEKYVSEVTRFCLRTPNERARIEVLATLDGVSWPTASVILHFFHLEPYPILDYRALWSVSIDVPSQYGFELWSKYVDFCRRIAKKNRVRMRTLDKALWQYSKENQQA